MRATPAGIASAMFSILLVIMLAFVLEPVALVLLVVPALSCLGLD